MRAMIVKYFKTFKNKHRLESCFRQIEILQKRENRAMLSLFSASEVE